MLWRPIQHLPDSNLECACFLNSNSTSHWATHFQQIMLDTRLLALSLSNSPINRCRTTSFRWDYRHFVLPLIKHPTLRSTTLLKLTLGVESRLSRLSHRLGVRRPRSGTEAWTWFLTRRGRQFEVLEAFLMTLGARSLVRVGNLDKNPRRAQLMPAALAPLTTLPPLLHSYCT